MIDERGAQVTTNQGRLLLELGSALLDARIIGEFELRKELHGGENGAQLTLDAVDDFGDRSRTVESVLKRRERTGLVAIADCNVSGRQLFINSPGTPVPEQGAL